MKNERGITVTVIERVPHTLGLKRYAVVQGSQESERSVGTVFARTAPGARHRAKIKYGL